MNNQDWNGESIWRVHGDSPRRPLLGDVTAMPPSSGPKAGDAYLPFGHYRARDRAYMTGLPEARPKTPRPKSPQPARSVLHQKLRFGPPEKNGLPGDACGRIRGGSD